MGQHAACHCTMLHVYWLTPQLSSCKDQSYLYTLLRVLFLCFVSFVFVLVCVCVFSSVCVCFCSCVCACFVCVCVLWCFCVCVCVNSCASFLQAEPSRIYIAFITKK